MSEDESNKPDDGLSLVEAYYFEKLGGANPGSYYNHVKLLHEMLVSAEFMGHDNVTLENLDKMDIQPHDEQQYRAISQCLVDSYTAARDVLTGMNLSFAKEFAGPEIDVDAFLEKLNDDALQNARAAMADLKPGDWRNVFDQDIPGPWRPPQRGEGHQR